MLSIPLSWLSGGKNRGNVIHHLGFLRSPEEKRSQPIITLLNKHDNALKPLHSNENIPSLVRLISNPDLFYWHLAQLPNVENDAPHKAFCRTWICAEWQIINNQDIQGLLNHLQEDECLSILQHRELLQAMEKFVVKA